MTVKRTPAGNVFRRPKRRLPKILSRPRLPARRMRPRTSFSCPSRERFPEAKEVIGEDFEQAMARLTPNESSYIVIVARGHRDDMRVLRWAVQTRAKYIGMIGSKRKTITIFRELTKEGIPAELFERVHAPVGLDIGAITPEEIAVAITAELIAVRRHAERAQPHMSWFKSRTAESNSAEQSVEAHKED